MVKIVPASLGWAVESTCLELGSCIIILLIITYSYTHTIFCGVNAANSGVLKLAGNDGDIQTLTVTFEILLSFATSAPRPPPAGYKPMPKLAFEDQRSPFPRANTSSNTLYLSIAEN